MVQDAGMKWERKSPTVFELWAPWTEVPTRFASAMERRKGTNPQGERSGEWGEYRLAKVTRPSLGWRCNSLGHSDWARSTGPEDLAQLKAKVEERLKALFTEELLLTKG